MKAKTSEKNIKTLIQLNLLNLEFITNLKNFNKNNIVLLDPLIFIKSIQQIIRVLQFLKNQKVSYLRLDVYDDDFIKTIFSKNFLTKKKINLLIVNPNIDNSKINLKINKIKKVSQLYLYINSNSFTPNYFKSLFLQKIFMVYSINANKDSNNLGHYKFYTDLNEIKKIFFFSILLNKYL